MERRKSSRCNGAVKAEQQKLADTVKRKASGRPIAATAVIPVLSESMGAAATLAYEKYAAASLSRHMDEAGPSTGGRSMRRRLPGSRGSGGGAATAGESADSYGDAAEQANMTALGPGTATAEAAAARGGEEDGQHFLNLLETQVSRTVALPKPLQEALMHVLLNATTHASSLSARAYALLDRQLQAHPPVVVQGEELLENEQLWDPVSCRWESKPLAGQPRFLGLKQAGGLATLVASAHNCVAHPLAVANGPGFASAPGAPPTGDAGEVLLLLYWVQLLQADLDVRLAAVRRSGYARSWTGQLQNSLVVRLMGTITTWSDGAGSKPALVKLLLNTVVFAHMATVQQLTLSTCGAAHAADLVGGPREVGSAAAALLRMFYDAFTALERMHAFVQRGSVSLGNDLVQLDKVVGQVLVKEAALYGQPQRVMALLETLPRPATVRVLVHLLTEAAMKRTSDADAGGLTGNLLRVAEHYLDRGVHEPPTIRASDALSFLLDEEPAQAGAHSRPGRSVWGWASTVLRFNHLPAKAGLPLFVAVLATAALEQARQEMAGLRQVPGQGQHGGGGEDGQEVGAQERAWADEAAAVADLYQRVAERLETEGAWQAAPACARLSRRCADRLAGSVRRGVGAGATAGV